MPDVNAKLTSRAVPLAEGSGEKDAARAGKRSRYRRASSGDAETEERIRRLSAAERADLKAQLEELKVPGGRVESVLGAIERRKLKALPPPSAAEQVLSWWRRLLSRLRAWWKGA
jgi:hypothetical protein